MTKREKLRETEIDEEGEKEREIDRGRDSERERLIYIYRERESQRERVNSALDVDERKEALRFFCTGKEGERECFFC